MYASRFLRGKLGLNRLRGLTAAVILVFIVFLDVRPATTPTGQISAQNFNGLNCGKGCYAFGSYSLRVLIDGQGVIRVVFFDSKALTGLSLIPALLALASVDYISAGMLTSVYVASIIQARLSVPKPQLPIKDVPRNTKCLIIGVNDYIESYNMRWNHSCGYINFVSHMTGTTEKEVDEVKVFAQAVERYGDLFDLLFVRKGAGVDAGVVLSSVPDSNMGMGEIFETPETTRKTVSTEENKIEKVVFVSRLRGVPDGYHEKIDGLKRFTARRDSVDSPEKATLSNIFNITIPNAFGKLCSGKYLNMGDCMRNRADSVLTIQWDRMAFYAIYLVGLYACYLWMFPDKVKDPIELYSHAAMGAICMFLGALLIGALGARTDDWIAWYGAGGRSTHVQNVLLVALVLRSTWKACETIFQ